jgi:hypothetical protein
MGKTLLIAFVLIGCTEHGQTADPTPREFFERSVEPIFFQGCAGNTSGCHGGEFAPAPQLGLDSYNALVPRFTGDFTDISSLLPPADLTHTGIELSPDVRARLEEWFALERGE